MPYAMYVMLGDNSLSLHGEMVSDDLICFLRWWLKSGGESERLLDMGEIIMWSWDLGDCCMWVNLPFLIWQVWPRIRQVGTSFWGLLTPLRHVIPQSGKSHLNQADRTPVFSYTRVRFILFPSSSPISDSCTQLFHHCRTPSYVIPVYLSMPWSSVNTEYRIYQGQHTPSMTYIQYDRHQVQHTPSTTYTQYDIHPVRHTPSTTYINSHIPHAQHTLSAASTHH